MGEQVDARFFGGLAQLGEHLPCKQGVESSNLLSSTRMMKRAYAPANPRKRNKLYHLTYLENRIQKRQKKYSKIILMSAKIENQKF